MDRKVKADNSSAYNAIPIIAAKKRFMQIMRGTQCKKGWLYGDTALIHKHLGRNGLQYHKRLKMGVQMLNRHIPGEQIGAVEKIKIQSVIFKECHFAISFAKTFLNFTFFKSEAIYKPL